ncbi:MAG: hypothetical protein WA906_05700, partial [Pacificimonas sp.]
MLLQRLRDSLRRRWGVWLAVLAVHGFAFWVVITGSQVAIPLPDGESLILVEAREPLVEALEVTALAPEEEGTSSPAAELADPVETVAPPPDVIVELPEPP